MSKVSKGVICCQSKTFNLYTCRT